MITEKAEVKNRIFGLDLFRAVAIFYVVCSHGSFLLNNTILTNFPFIKMIDGVDLFFVLSGFLIGSILLKEINKKELFKLNSLMNFWKRRWFRTLPNYFIILLLNIIFVKFEIIKEDITQFNFRFFIFLQNFSDPFYGFFWESWSLSVEEWFYIFSPILLMLFLKFLNPKRAFIVVALLMILIPLYYRISILDFKIDDFWYDVTFRKTVLSRLDSIAYGLVAAWFCFYYNHLWLKYKMLFFILGIGLIVFIVNYSSPNNSLYKQVIYLSITPISAMLILPYIQNIKNYSGFIPRIITYISKISYSMYLVNLALVAEVFSSHFPVQNNLDAYLKYGLYWTIVLVFSSVLYTFIEKPFMKLRDRI